MNICDEIIGRTICTSCLAFFHFFCRTFNSMSKSSLEILADAATTSSHATDPQSGDIGLELLANAARSLQKVSGDEDSRVEVYDEPSKRQPRRRSARAVNSLIIDRFSEFIGDRSRHHFIYRCDFEGCGKRILSYHTDLKARKALLEHLSQHGTELIVAKSGRSVKPVQTEIVQIGGASGEARPRRGRKRRLAGGRETGADEGVPGDKGRTIILSTYSGQDDLTCMIPEESTGGESADERPSVTASESPNPRLRLLVGSLKQRVSSRDDSAAAAAAAAEGIAGRSSGGGARAPPRISLPSASAAVGGDGARSRIGRSVGRPRRENLVQTTQYGRPFDHSYTDCLFKSYHWSTATDVDEHGAVLLTDGFNSTLHSSRTAGYRSPSRAQPVPLAVAAGLSPLSLVGGRERRPLPPILRRPSQTGFVRVLASTVSDDDEGGSLGLLVPPSDEVNTALKVVTAAEGLETGTDTGWVAAQEVVADANVPDGSDELMATVYRGAAGAAAAAVGPRRPLLAGESALHETIIHYQPVARSTRGGGLQAISNPMSEPLDDEEPEESAAIAEEKRLASECLDELSSRRKPKSLTCRICHSVLGSNATLVSHYRSHLGVKPFICGTCGASFTRQHSLNYHMLIHFNRTRFRCEICTRTFRHPSHFRVCP